MSEIVSKINMLSKGQIVFCKTDSQAYNIHETDAVSIKPVSVRGTTIKFIPIDTFSFAEWIYKKV